MAAAARNASRMLIKKPWTEWVFYKSGFYKYGLMRDDMRHEDADVTEALRRCPQDLVDARTFRIIRAAQYNMMHSVAPEREWVKFEDDVMYLKPYLDEVIAEREEKEAWNKE